MVNTTAKEEWYKYNSFQYIKIIVFQKNNYKSNTLLANCMKVNGTEILKMEKACW
jgi:hypothetical protein